MRIETSFDYATLVCYVDKLFIVLIHSYLENWSIFQLIFSFRFQKLFKIFRLPIDMLKICFITLSGLASILLFMLSLRG